MTPPAPNEPRRIACAARPSEVLAAWPPDRPLACVWGAEGGDHPWSRWTVIAEPEAFEAIDPGISLAPRRGRDGMARPSGPPFQGGWIGWLGYEAGRVIEPAAGRGPAPAEDRGWPLGGWLRCPSACMFDRSNGEWWVTGEPGPAGAECCHRPVRLGPFESRTGRAAFEESVSRAVEYIRAGDVFQVNLSHRLSAPFSGSARGLFLAMARAARPRHGAYLEFTEGGVRRAIVSMSPELFLWVEPGGRVVTRPMKGTAAAAAGEGAILGSAKNRAELAMIVDLMRNDLGRVCEFGSVRVAEACTVERHGGTEQRSSRAAEQQIGGVLQGVATVEGRLRRGMGLEELLRAAFPGGSITGAPKIRAMQIIEELEPVARGPYCGAVGFVSESGHAMLNMAIRTAVVTGAPGAGGLDEIAEGVIDYGVGAGIVAESDPAAEWEETMLKAEILTGTSPVREHWDAAGEARPCSLGRPGSAREPFPLPPPSGRGRG